MQLVPSHRAFAAAAAFAVLAAALLLLGGGARPALAAQVIDPTSCGGAGSPNCTNLPPNITIGANSCTILGACDDIGDGVSIGAGSCNASDACDQAGRDDVGDGAATIGDGSCNASTACNVAGSGYDFAGFASIGNNACNAASACTAAGFGRVHEANATIGEGSCNGTNACKLDSAFVVIGVGSCGASQACENAGSRGEVHISDHSCIGTQACAFAGASGYASIGHNSCGGIEACTYAGWGDDDPGTATIQDNSCNGTSACYNAGASGSAAIGSWSCNQSGPYNAWCRGTPVDVGDCIYNSPAVPCATVTVTKDFTDNSNATVEIALSCAEADSVSANGTEELGDGESVAYLVAFDGESLSCVLSEASSPGYVASVTCGGTPVQQGSLTLGLTAGDAAQCTFTNTPIDEAERSASVTLRKVFTDHSTGTVEVHLDCPDATAIGVNSPEVLGDGGSVLYDVTFVGTSTACDASESGTPGYDSSIVCIDAEMTALTNLTLTPGADIDCTFTNSPGEDPDPDPDPDPTTATVTVRKLFTDHSNATIEAQLVCDGSGVSADGSQRLGDGDSVTYEVTFEAASVHCEVSESGGEGYYSTTACTGADVVRRGSLEFNLEGGASVECTFTNSPVDSGDESASGGGHSGGGNGTSSAPTCTSSISAGSRPPAAGGFGTFAFCGGTFEALLAASGCPQATSVFFNNKLDGNFAAWVPGTEVAVANEAILALFAGTPPIPSGTIFTARCI